MYTFICICVFVRLYLEDECTDSHQIWHSYSVRPFREHRCTTTPGKVPDSEPRWGRFLQLGHQARRKKSTSITDVCFEEKITETNTTTPQNCTENGFCCSQTKHYRLSAPDTKLLADCRNKGQDTEKLSWVWKLTRMFSVARKLSTKILHADFQKTKLFYKCWLISSCYALYSTKELSEPLIISLASC